MRDKARRSTREREIVLWVIHGEGESTASGMKQDRDGEHSRGDRHKPGVKGGKTRRNKGS